MAAQVTGGHVTLPGVGSVSKKALLLGGGAAAAVMAVLWWRKRHAAAAPAALDPNALDPNADLSSGMAGGGGALVGPSPSSVPAAPATNAQWATEAMNKLAFEDPSALSKALGLYVTGKAVTPDQSLLVDEARGVEGDPPVAGPGGYPPAIRTQPSGGQTNPPARPAATTNDQWRRDALAWFGRQPKFAGTTPVLAQIAINDYLAGKRIRGTWEEWTVQTVITGTNQLGQHFEAGIGYPPDPPNTPF